MFLQCKVLWRHDSNFQNEQLMFFMCIPNLPRCTLLALALLWRSSPDFITYCMKEGTGEQGSLLPHVIQLHWGWSDLTNDNYSHLAIDPLYYSHTSHTPHVETKGLVTLQLMSCHQEMQWWCNVAGDICQPHCDVTMATGTNGINSDWSN